jgi:hypothetical protein
MAVVAVVEQCPLYGVEDSEADANATAAPRLFVQGCGKDATQAAVVDSQAAGKLPAGTARDSRRPRASATGNRRSPSPPSSSSSSPSSPSPSLDTRTTACGHLVIFSTPTRPFCANSFMQYIHCRPSGFLRIWVRAQRSLPAHPAANLRSASASGFVRVHPIPTNSMRLPSSLPTYRPKPSRLDACD